MRVLIVEDEAPARARLEQALARAQPGAEIVAALPSVAQAIAWLGAHPAPDLILADVQLADGLSFEIFARVPVACPVIFCTAYEEYVVEALSGNGIEYLLKPITDEAVARALAKYRRLEAHFAARVAAAAEAVRAPAGAPGGAGGRRRLLARKAGGFVTVKLDEVAYFVVRDKLVDVVTTGGAVLAVDRGLAELEAELAAGESGEFFRVNRQFLARAGAVKGFQPFGKGKLRVDLVPPPPDGDEVVVSQENAARFKAWIDR